MAASRFTFVIKGEDVVEAVAEAGVEDEDGALALPSDTTTMAPIRSSRRRRDLREGSETLTSPTATSMVSAIVSLKAAIVSWSKLVRARPDTTREVSTIMLGEHPQRTSC
jgi:hypothetical protein